MREIYCDAGYERKTKLAGCGVYIPDKGITYGASYRNISKVHYAELISIFLAAQMFKPSEVIIYSDCQQAVEHINNLTTRIPEVYKKLILPLRESGHRIEWKSRAGNGYANAVATQQLNIARKDISKTLEFM